MLLQFGGNAAPLVNVLFGGGRGEEGEEEEEEGEEDESEQFILSVLVWM